MGSQSFPSHRPPSKPLASASTPPPQAARAPAPLAAAAKTPIRPPNPNPNPNPDLPPPSADVLTREEVLRRRARRLRRLHRCYLDQYWALAEEVRSKHREYYWNHGQSPVEEDRSPGEGEGAAAVAAGGEPGTERERCAYAGCKTNAMPLTRFCHAHIMSDRKQTLYKPCSYAIKSGHSGPITCGKPVLRAAVPSLCSVHFQRAQKHISHALKKAGLSTSSASRPAPKFHVIIAEYVRQIQAKRRGSQTAAKSISKLG